MKNIKSTLKADVEVSDRDFGRTFLAVYCLFVQLFVGCGCLVKHLSALFRKKIFFFETLFSTVSM